MAYAIGSIVICVVLYLIFKAATSNRYANMTEEQLEQEAKRSSKVGAAVIGFQKVVDPGHRVEYAQEQQQRIEAAAAESGAPPGRQSNGEVHSELEHKIIEEG
jgi:hypothetical protein